MAETPTRDYSNPDSSRLDNWLCECGRFCHAERNDLTSRVEALETEDRAIQQGTVDALVEENDKLRSDLAHLTEENGRLRALLDYEHPILSVAESEALQEELGQFGDLSNDRVIDVLCSHEALRAKLARAVLTHSPEASADGT